MKNFLLLFLFYSYMFFESCLSPSDKKIIDNDFKSVKIGNQIWMSENLRVDTFRNGDPIPNVDSLGEFDKTQDSRPAWCCSYVDSVTGKEIGKLYNWYAVNDMRGLAPSGWHISTSSDWDELINFLGGEDSAIAKIKSVQGWDISGNNSSGFSAFPISGNQDKYSSRWVEEDGSYHLNENMLFGNLAGKEYFLFVRCLKDE
jgi:uncharacterized protein (TIGR02145 family)